MSSEASRDPEHEPPPTTTAEANAVIVEALVNAIVDDILARDRKRFPRERGRHRPR